MILLGDVGGTNLRFALADAGGLRPETVMRHTGRDHSGLEDLLGSYLQRQGAPHLDAVCRAFAGPVAGDVARLTNRGWSVSRGALMRLTGAERVVMINDLTALGLVVPGLAGDAVAPLHDGAAGVGADESNRQTLVVNAGTGFDTCPLIRLPDGRAACLEAEEGHASLPFSMVRMLTTRTGARCAVPPSVEALFSGRGLVQFHAARTGDMRTAPEITAAAAAGDAAARDSMGHYARLFGLMCRELANRHLPRGGIYLADGVGRAAAAHAADFTAGFLQDPPGRVISRPVPLWVIRDDLAGLYGCLAALSEESCLFSPASRSRVGF